MHLAYAPTNPREFNTLAIRMAEILKPGNLPARPAAETGNNGEHPRSPVIYPDRLDR